MHRLANACKTETTSLEAKRQPPLPLRCPDCGGRYLLSPDRLQALPNGAETRLSCKMCSKVFSVKCGQANAMNATPKTDSPSIVTMRCPDCSAQYKVSLGRFNRDLSPKFKCKECMAIFKLEEGFAAEKIHSGTDNTRKPESSTFPGHKTEKNNLKHYDVKAELNLQSEKTPDSNSAKDKVPTKALNYILIFLTGLLIGVFLKQGSLFNFKFSNSPDKNLNQQSSLQLPEPETAKQQTAEIALKINNDRFTVIPDSTSYNVIDNPLSILPKLTKLSVINSNYLAEKPKIVWSFTDEGLEIVATESQHSNSSTIEITGKLSESTNINFSIVEDPKRLVLDLYGIANLNNSDLALKENSLIKNIRSGHHSEFTRLVFDLYSDVGIKSSTSPEKQIFNMTLKKIKP